MCGIAGFIDRSSEAEADTVLGKMLGRLTHRGPDGEGRWVQRTPDGWTVALGHRRLSIIDIAGGAQPLGNEDGSLQITFNGEIYNFQELRKSLEGQGHHFRTRSDTEVTVHQFERHRTSGLSSLNGMFAFAVWDGPNHRLTLARDRAGIKPLYYVQLPSGGIAFASELTSLISYPGVSRQLDWDATLSLFFADSIPAPQSAISGVRKLRPGAYFEWDSRRSVADEKVFWSLNTESAPPAEIAGKSDEDLADELWSRLRAAVKLQMIADVPVGTFLSGGIDSSIIATLAREIGGDQLQTFSVAFEEADFDEGAYARLMAKRLGTKHTERVLNERILLETVDAALSALDEPLGDPSILPTFLLSQVAAQHVKVALGGDAGDELWAGYPTYKAHAYNRVYERIPNILHSAVIEPIVANLPVNPTYQSFEWKAKRFVMRWDRDPLRRHLRWMSGTDLPPLKKAFPGLAQEPRVLREVAAHVFDETSANRYLALDFRTYLPGSVLTKVDRAAMASSLEVRPPFLDNDLVDWAFSLPYTMKLRGGVGKYLLKRAALTHLPAEIVNRRKKGFGIPLARWLRGPLAGKVRATLKESPLWESRQISREVFSQWADRHFAGKEDLSKPLWSLVVTDHWMKREGVRASD